MSQTKQKNKILILGILGFIALALGLFIAKLYRQTGLSEKELADRNATILATEKTAQESTEQIATVLTTERNIQTFNLITHDNKPFTQSNLVGQWTVLYFGFTNCPDICPTTLTTLSKVKKIFDKKDAKVQYILVSVDSQRDNPEKLAEYVAYFDPEFIGVTGSEEEILNFAKQFYATFYKIPGDKPENYQVEHTTHIIIINPEGKYHAFLQKPHLEKNIVAALKSIIFSNK